MRSIRTVATTPQDVVGSPQGIAYISRTCRLSERQVFVLQRGTPLRYAADQFFLDCAARRLTCQSQEFYRFKLGVLLRWAEDQGLTDLGELDHRQLRRFLVDLSQRNYSDQYQHNIARAARAFFNFCVRDELLPRSPFDKVQMPRLAQEALVALTDTEVQRILRASQHERDKALVLFLLDSGVRASELLALNIGDLDLTTGAVRVRQGKGRKDRATFVGARTRKQTARYLRLRLDTDPNLPLFASLRGGGRLTLDGLGSVDISFEPDECRHEAQEAHEALIQLIETGEEPPVVLELVDQALDEMALAVEMLVVVALAASWNDRFRPQGADVSHQRVGIIAFVGNDVRTAPLGQQRLGLGDVRYRAGREDEVEWVAQRIHQDVDFAAEPTATAA